MSYTEEIVKHTNYEDKPEIAAICLKNGKRINNCVLDWDAPQIPGFIAIEATALVNANEPGTYEKAQAVQYIALSSIETMLLSVSELSKASASLFIPATTVKVQR